jgi:hypothetical protein
LEEKRNDRSVVFDRVKRLAKRGSFVLDSAATRADDHALGLVGVRSLERY